MRRSAPLRQSGASPSSLHARAPARAACPRSSTGGPRRHRRRGAGSGAGVGRHGAGHRRRAGGARVVATAAPGPEVDSGAQCGKRWGASGLGRSWSGSESGMRVAGSGGPLRVPELVAKSGAADPHSRPPLGRHNSKHTGSGERGSVAIGGPGTAPCDGSHTSLPEQLAPPHRQSTESRRADACSSTARNGRRHAIHHHGNSVIPEFISMRSYTSRNS